MDDFIDWDRSTGHDPAHRDYEDWFARFETALKALPEKQRQHSSLPLLHQLRRPMPASAGAAVSARSFHAMVRRVGVGSHRDIPHLSEALIAKYIVDLRAVGLLDDAQ